MARITVEDCLRSENNRFALVLLASQRAKQLLGGATPLTDSKGNKSIVTALREIADSKVRFMTAEEVQLEDEMEQQRLAEEAEMREARSELSNGPVISQGPLAMVANGNGAVSESIEDSGSEPDAE